jgi:ubiquitin carboxyl-terminal hydrolase 25
LNCSVWELTALRYYAGLGTVGDFSDALLLYAYTRQVAEDRNNAVYYFECLQDLAVGRKSEMLQMEVSRLASLGLTSRRDLISAYQYFRMDPSHARVLNDDHIIDQFQSLLPDISPTQREEARQKLRVIGNARNSNKILQAASDSIETYDQALSWLGAEESTPDDFIPALFTLKVSSHCSETHLCFIPICP